MENKKYSYGDPDVVTIINRESIEEDLSAHAKDNFESEFVNEEGCISDNLFNEIREEINEGLWEFLMDCYSRVDDRLIRVKNNENADKENPHYNVYWKNENVSQFEFKLIGVYKTIKDANDFIHDWRTSRYEDKFKVVECKDGIEDEKNLYVPFFF